MIPYVHINVVSELGSALNSQVYRIVMFRKRVPILNLR